MTTLATASVELVADGSRLPSSITQEVQKAAPAADRAGRDTGRRLGTGISSGAQGAMRGVSQALGRALDPAPIVRSFSTGFQRIGGVASGLTSTFQAVGTATSRALSPVINGIGRFGDGFRNADAAASVFSGHMGSLGGVARRAVDGISTGLSGLRERFSQAADGGNLLESTLGRIGAAGAAFAAVAGLGSLGSEIIGVASSAQTTEASLLALYEAAGGGAKEVNEVMSEMATRFRGLDMSVMNEGATTLAYMGLQGSEAVDVLERLDAATTAAGTGATGMTRALDAMTKGVNAGKFMMGELSQISNAGIPIYDALADVLGVDIPEAQAMASAGAIQLEHVLDALSGEFGTWFPALMSGAEGVGNTFAGSWDTIRSTIVNGLANEVVPLLDRLAPAMARLASGVDTAFSRLPVLIENVLDAGRESGAFDTLRGAFEGIRDVVSALAPIFGGFISGMTSLSRAALEVFGALTPVGDVLSRFAGWLRENETALRILGTALGGMVAGLAVYRGAAMAATVASRVLAGGMRGIGVAIRGIPLIGWALAAVGVLVSLYQTSDRFREVVQNAFDRVRGAVASAWEYIQPAWDSMVETLSQLWSAVSGWTGWRTAWEGIRNAVSTAWGVISGVWDSLTAGWNRLVDFGDDVGWWDSIWESMSGAVQTAWSVIQVIWEQMRSGWELLSGVFTGDTSWADVFGYLVDGAGRLREIGTIIGTFLLDELRRLPGRVRPLLRVLGTAILDWFRSLPGRVSNLLVGSGGSGGLLGWISDVVRQVPARMAALGTAILGWFRSLPGRVSAVMTGSDGGGGILGWISGAVRQVPARMAALGAAILGWFRSLPGRVSDVMTGSDGGGGILGWLTDTVGQVPARMAALGEAVLEWFRDLPGRVSTVMSGADGDGGILGWVSDAAKQVPRRMIEFGRAVASWLTNDLPGFISTTLSGGGEGSGLLGWISDAAKQVPRRMVEFGRAVASWLSQDLPGYISRALRGDGDGGLLGWVRTAVREIPARLQAFAEGVVSWLTNDLPSWIESNIDPGAIVEWLKDVPSRITDFMSEYGVQILKGFAVAIGVVVLGIPALLLGLLAAILLVLGTIAVELALWAYEAFTNMMLRAGEAIAAKIGDIVAWFAGLPDRVMESISGFGDQLVTWGNSALGSLRGAFDSGLSSLTSLWSTAWTTLRTSASTAWTNIVSWATTQAELLRDRVMTPVTNLKDRMIEAFQAARDGIGRAWEGLKKKVAAPINWVIETGYGGIKNVWDKVVTKFGGDKLPAAPPKLAFASGGVFPGYTPGRDVHAMPMAAFSGGESVLRPEVTKAWGARTTHMLNKLARTGGVGAVRRALAMLFSGQNPFTGRSVPASSNNTGGGGFVAHYNRGGIIGGAAGRVWGWLNSTVEDFADGMVDFLEDPSGMLKRLVNGMVDWDGIPGAGQEWSKLMVKIPKKILEDLAKKAKELFSIDAEGDWINVGGNVGGRLGAALRFAKSQAGKPYVWGGVGPRGYDCCIIGGVRIYGPHGAKKIEDMRPGDEVYSYVDGRLEAHHVNAVWQSEHQEVFAVRTRNRKVTASANHPFMRLVKRDEVSTYTVDAQWHGPVDMPRGSRGTMECTVSTCTHLAWSRGMCNTHLTPWRKYGDPRTKQVRTHSYKVEWARVDELQRGDLLVQPRQMPDCGKPNPLLPGGVPVDADLAWLIGAMVGDGTVTDKGIRLALYGDKREKATRILLSNVAARDVFTSIGMRRLGPDKRVPDAVWEWSRELQQAFLDGYCDADGHRPADSRRHGDRTYHSASEDLIEDVRALHIILGDPVSNISVTERTKPIVIKGKTVKNARPQYGFTVWRNSGRGESAVRNRPGIAEWLDSGDFTVAKVLDVTSEGTQDTWDMEVDQAHNFVADGVVVHNSGFMSAIHNVILGKSPYSRRYTTHSFNGTSANGFRRNFPSPFTIGNTHASVGHMAGTLLRTNVESRGSVGVVVGSRARGTTNPLFTSRWGLVGAGGGGGSKRMGGEGILYDRGGWLMPGMSLVSNHTGKPESIRTYAQEQNVARLVKLTEPVIKNLSMVNPAQIDRSDAEQLRRLLGEGPGAGTVVNAPVTVNTIAQDPEQVAYKTAARIAQMAGI